MWFTHFYKLLSCSQLYKNKCLKIFVKLLLKANRVMSLVIFGSISGNIASLDMAIFSILNYLIKSNPQVYRYQCLRKNLFQNTIFGESCNL